MWRQNHQSASHGGPPRAPDLRRHHRCGGRPEFVPRLLDMRPIGADVDRVELELLERLLAPRPVYVASAVEDRWCDPQGEFLSARYAEPVYRLFGLGGLGTDAMPAVNQPVGERIGYHLRTGKHDITAYDWEQYLAFADRHFKTTGARPGVPPR